jgi:hypothetical protein
LKLDDQDNVKREWTVGKPMLTTKVGYGLIAKDGFMYAIGGSIDFNSLPMTRIDQYDVANDIWLPTTKSLPIACWRFCAVLVKGTDIWTIGGNQNPG